MFTGIIEQMGTVVAVEKHLANKIFTIQAAVANELKIDQSVAHNGVCLTVINILPQQQYQVEAIAQTLQVSNLNSLEINNLVNLERCMPATGRFDGHIVQGHVDTTAQLVDIKDAQGSYNLTFEYAANAGITVERGSITLNGISLTIAQCTSNAFTVSIIPYTWQHTNLHSLKIWDSVNVEFDILGKYIQRILAV